MEKSAIHGKGSTKRSDESEEYFEEGEYYMPENGEEEGEYDFNDGLGDFDFDLEEEIND